MYHVYILFINQCPLLLFHFYILCVTRCMTYTCGSGNLFMSNPQSTYNSYESSCFIGMLQNPHVKRHFYLLYQIYVSVCHSCNNRKLILSHRKVYNVQRNMKRKKERNQEKSNKWQEEMKKVGKSLSSTMKTKERCPRGQIFCLLPNVSCI